MLDSAISKNGIPIRLTAERWAHITEEHTELAGLRLEVLEAITNPERILLGKAGELLAVQELLPGKFLLAVYREQGEDGFVITAFLTRKVRALEKRRQVWP